MAENNEDKSNSVRLQVNMMVNNGSQAKSERKILWEYSIFYRLRCDLKCPPLVPHKIIVKSLKQ